MLVRNIVPFQAAYAHSSLQMSKQTLTRKQLYDQVWSKPMTKLARDYGLSDVGLAKVCKRHDIPRPPPGYWAKKRVGKNPRKSPLPRPDEEGSINLREASEAEKAAAERAASVPKHEAPAGPLVTIAETLRGAHRLVSEANEQLQGAKVDDSGLLVTPDGLSLNIRVSRTSQRRALLILDAILKNCEQRGYQTSAGPKIQIQGQELTFSITEHTEIVREEEPEPDLSGRYSFHYNRFRQNRKPSGKFTLQIDHVGYLPVQTRHAWRDTEKHRVEDRLNQCVAALISIAEQKKQHQEEEERRRKAENEAQKKRQEEAERRAERRKLQKSEQAKVDSLVASAKNWQVSQNLRAFIDARRQQHIAAHGEVATDSEFSRWMEWATQQANRLDPLTASPPSILDENLGEEEPPRSAPYSWYNR